MRLLPRSATGQSISNYVDICTGVKGAASSTAPEHMYFILVDSGRTSVLGSEVREALRCIRCGACMNHCPVYQNIGGHAYGWVYPGPIGSILTPMYVGLENAPDLPQASTFCNQCGVVCPVKIPLPDLQRKLREREFREHQRPWSERAGLKLWAWLARVRRCMRSRAGSACASCAALRRRRTDPPSAFGRGWTMGRDMPAPRAHVPRAVSTAKEHECMTPNRAMPKLSRARGIARHRERLRRAGGGQRARAVRQGHHLVLHRPARLPDADHVQDAAIEAIRGGKHGYTPSAGIDELRMPAAKDLGARAASTSRRRRRGRRGAQALHRVHDRVGHRLRAGDEVIYPVPGFPIYESQILANGAVPVPIYLREARQFAFDPAELEAKITPKTRLLILNTPQNPTGGILGHATSTPSRRSCARIRRSGCSPTRSTRARVRRQVRLARTRPACSSARSSATARPRPWAMTGWRIGYVANKTLAPVFTRWITNTESCASQISQWAAVAAITGPQAAPSTCARASSSAATSSCGLLNEVPGITAHARAARSTRGRT
jgi:ferredoxin